MENASKALVMAGGILIAILVVGSLLLMFNQLSYYQRSNSDITKNSQLSEFNQQFVQYSRNDLQGVELVSLVNKVVDYNRRTSGYGEINYDEKITLNITITDAFRNKYGAELNQFTPGVYTITNNSDSFVQSINVFRAYEEEYTLDALTLLLSNYDNIENGSITVEELLHKPLTDSSGDPLSLQETLDLINRYSEFSLLKSSTFRAQNEVQYYTDGQVKSLAFIYMK